MQWLTFAYSLPSGKKSSSRVTLWRRLQRLGAVAPAGNMYFLPNIDDCEESFEWLAQEVVSAGGQAIVTTVEKVGVLSEDDLIGLFCEARGKEYQALFDEAVSLDGSLQAVSTPSQISDFTNRLNKLRTQQRDVQRIDYFDCPEGAALQGKLRQLEQQVLQDEDAVDVVVRNSAEFLNCTWTTRPQPHVDRLASIWLIRRHIDANATIHFTTKPAKDDVTFDMTDADFGHTGTLCTFETLHAAFAIDAPGLQTLAEIVHEIDLHDGRYFHHETAGIDAVLLGWRESNMNDEELMAHGLRLFDGLLATLAKREGSA